MAKTRGGKNQVYPEGLSEGKGEVRVKRLVKNLGVKGFGWGKHSLKKRVGSKVGSKKAVYYRSKHATALGCWERGGRDYMVGSEKIGPCKDQAVVKKRKTEGIGNITHGK